MKLRITECEDGGEGGRGWHEGDDCGAGMTRRFGERAIHCRKSGSVSPY